MACFGVKTTRRSTLYTRRNQRAKHNWHRNPGSLRVVKTSRSRFKWSYRISECQIRLLIYWHRNPGSLREPGTCRRPLLWIGEGVRRSKQGLTHLAPESWKSARVRNVSQTIALDWGGSQEVKTILSSFGTGILEVCECPKRVADHCFGLGWVLGGQNNT